jgi:hypothetical protein
MPNPTEIPLRFAPVCFPPASPPVAREAGKQKKVPKASSQPLICLKKIGAGEGIRTLDPDLGKSLNVRRNWLGKDRSLGGRPKFH